jgi:hypothetical protein
MNKLIDLLDDAEFQDDIDTLFAYAGYVMLVFVGIVIVGGTI